MVPGHALHVMAPPPAHTGSKTHLKLMTVFSMTLDPRKEQLAYASQDLHETRMPACRGAGKLSTQLGAAHLASLMAVSPPSTPVFIGSTCVDSMPITVTCATHMQVPYTWGLVRLNNMITSLITR